MIPLTPIFAGAMKPAAAAAGYRYWRILATDVSWVNYLSTYPYFQTLWTISFFASADGSGTDLCIGKTASARSFFASDPTYNAAKANDNNASTRWATDASTSVNTPQWWAIDLGAGGEANIQSVKIATFSTAYHAKAFALQYSSDGVNWTTKSSFSPASTTSATLTFSNL